MEALRPIAAASPCNAAGCRSGMHVRQLCSDPTGLAAGREALPGTPTRAAKGRKSLHGVDRRRPLEPSSKAGVYREFIPKPRLRGAFHGVRQAVRRRDDFGVEADPHVGQRLRLDSPDASPGRIPTSPVRVAQRLSPLRRTWARGEGSSGDRLGWSPPNAGEHGRRVDKHGAGDRVPASRTQPSRCSGVCRRPARLSLAREGRACA